MKVPLFTLILLSLSGCAGAPEIPPRRPLPCTSTQAIRDFKDTAYAINPTPGIDEKWAKCLCGGQSAAAGFNDPRPKLNPQMGLPGFPAYITADPARSLRRERDFFLKYLPVDEAQAAVLVNCVWGKEMGPIP